MVTPMVATALTGGRIAPALEAAGASAPEVLVQEAIDFLMQHGFSKLEEIELMPENVRFALPPEIVEAIGAAPALPPNAAD